MQTLADIPSLTELPHAVVLVGDREEGELEILSRIERDFGISRMDPDLFFESTPIWMREHSSRLLAFVSRRPTGKRKAAVISASQFSDRSQDQLLKTLEEPAGATTLFIIVEREAVLLQTIRSRGLILRVGSDGEVRKEMRKSAIAFLNSSLPKRINLIASLTETLSGDSEKVKEEKRMQKEKARLFVQELAMVIESGKKKNGAEAVILASKLIGTPAPNLRLLLEHIAFSLQPSKESGK